MVSCWLWTILENDDIKKINVKNLIIVKDELIVLPYISKITDIKVDMSENLFYFEVYSMVTDSVIIYGSGVDVEQTHKFGELLTSIMSDKTYNKKDLNDKLKVSYDDLSKIRNKLLKEWDKTLSKIRKI